MSLLIQSVVALGLIFSGVLVGAKAWMRNRPPVEMRVVEVQNEPVDNGVTSILTQTEPFPASVAPAHGNRIALTYLKVENKSNMLTNFEIFDGNIRIGCFFLDGDGGQMEIRYPDPLLTSPGQRLWFRMASKGAKLEVYSESHEISNSPVKGALHSARMLNDLNQGATYWIPVTIEGRMTNFTTGIHTITSYEDLGTLDNLKHKNNPANPKTDGATIR